MKRRYLFYLVPILILGLFVYLINNTDIGTRMRRKIQTTVSALKPHPEYVPVPSVVSEHQESFVIPDKITNTPTPPENNFSVPASYFLNNLRHEYQSWNNCGPATLAMALSFYSLPQTQKDIAPYVKPDPEDKNVSPQELVEYVTEQTSYKIIYTFNLNLLKIKLLIANDIPVIVETWYEPHPNDGMGHYQLVQGYDETKNEFYLYDSYKGPHIAISEQKLDSNWKVFNRSVLVIYPQEKEQIVKNILGYNDNIENALQESLDNAQIEIGKDNTDVFAWFNLGTTYSLMGKHKEAVVSFDKARSLKLPWRMLWYQFSIFDSYLAEGRIQDVMDLTNSNLKQAENLEESLFYRAKAEIQQNKMDAARIDLQNALKYNKNYFPAQEELNRL